MALVAALLAVMIAILHGQRLSDGEWVGVASALSLALAPYAISHDYVILAFPWALTLARATYLRAARRRLIFFSVLVAASPLPWALETFAFGRGELLSPLVPASAALLLALSIRLGRDDGATERLPVTE